MTDRFDGDKDLRIPQALDVEHFAQARIQELEFLNAAVAAVSSQDGGEQSAGPQSSGGGLHDQSQALPRHMRRRTTSHKPRRMPVALRLSGKKGKKQNSRSRYATSRGPDAGKKSKTDQGVSGGAMRNFDDKDTDGVQKLEGGGGVVSKGTAERAVPMRCRKHRRRPRAMLEARSPHVERLDEESRSRWLETHIWHAKRMHMTEKWGFMLPAKSNRGPRAVVEAALKHCTVQDLTFLRPLEMRGSFNLLKGLLTAVLDPLDSRATHPDCTAGLVEASTHLYRVQEFPLGCIAPVTVLWSAPDVGTNSGGEREDGEGDAPAEGEEIRRLWLWVHPAAAEEASRELRNACHMEGAPWAGSIEVGGVAGGLCRLRVRGSKAHNVVQRVLRTAVAERYNSPADTVSFEDAARENALRWQAAASCFAFGGGGGSCSAGDDQKQCEGAREMITTPRQLPTGSVLALTALDPRDRPRQSNKAGASGARSRKGNGKIDDINASGSGNLGGRGGCERDTQSGGGGEVVLGEDRCGNASTSLRWNPRWAPVSPLWDPDARALSAKLARARRDDVINEVRRQERARTEWDAAATTSSATFPPSTAVTSSPDEYPHLNASRLGTENRRAGVASRAGAEGVSPVILISYSGESTKPHEASEEFKGGGRGKREKWVERKRLAVGAGWDIVLSAGWAPVFFHSLIMAGARALSIEDAGFLKLETGDPCFPADYPDTASGRRHWDEIGRRSESTWRRTRPKHRGYKMPSFLHTPVVSAPRSGDVAQAETEKGSAAEAVETCLSDEMEMSLEPAGEKGGEGDSELEVTASIVSPPCEWQDFGVEAKREMPLAFFRPDFRAIAGVIADKDVGHDDAGVDGEREPFALARGFHYIQAFLPELEILGEGGMPPPLQLAFPTTLEVRVRQDKGIPGAGCLLYAASHSDHVLWQQGELDRKPWPGYSNTVDSASDFYRPTTNVSDSHEYGGVNEVIVSETGRCGHGVGQTRLERAIGAVSSGGFSFLRGGGVGRAVCEAVAVRDALAATLSFSIHAAVGGGVGAGLGRPSALVMIDNEAGNWRRPAVIVIV